MRAYHACTRARERACVLAHSFPHAPFLFVSLSFPLASRQSRAHTTNVRLYRCVKHVSTHSCLHARPAEIYRVFLENREVLERLYVNLSHTKSLPNKLARNGTDTSNTFLNTRTLISLSASQKKLSAYLLSLTKDFRRYITIILIIDLTLIYEQIL